MTEFIGARISLISKSNIRYVGTLHEINSETSTVALEQVVSHGTEGRRGGEGEIAGSDNVYEYIVFRGSDVKDLRIEEPAQKKPPVPPPQLDDPAILGQSSRPYTLPQHPPGQFQQQGPPPMGMPPYYQFPPPQQPHQNFGPGLSPYQAVSMFGAYPPPMGGQSPMGMPGPGLAAPQQQQPSHQQQQQQQAPPAHPLQPPQQAQQPPQQPMQQPPQPNQQQPPTGPQNRAPRQAPIGPSMNRQVSGSARQPPAQASKPQEQLAQPTTVAVQQQPKVENTNQPKPTEQANAGAPVAAVPQNPATAPTGPKARGGIVPALPRSSPAARPSATTTANNATASSAQLPPKPEAAVNASAANAAVRDLADKVNRMAMTASNTAAASAPKPAAPAYASASVPRSADSPVPTVPAPGIQVAPHQVRTRQQPGTGNFVASRSRGSVRGSVNQQTRKVEVPTTDFDFQGNNEKFNKQDLVKEAIASGTDENAPHVTQVPLTNEQQAKDDGAVSIPPPPKDGFYNKKSSFFDNISCENKERAEAVPGERRGGAQFRSEEQKKNLETFGQGSVDGYGSGYRGGWRGGRGRGRGGYRGRGYGYSRGGGGTGGYRAQQQQTGTAAGN